MVPFQTWLQDWISYLYHVDKQEAFLLRQFICLLWTIWITRNRQWFGRQEPTTDRRYIPSTWVRVEPATRARELQKASLHHPQVLRKSPITVVPAYAFSSRSRPDTPIATLAVEAVWNRNGQRGMLGLVVLRMPSIASPILCDSALTAQLLALELAMTTAPDTAYLGVDV